MPHFMEGLMVVGNSTAPTGLGGQDPNTNPQMAANAVVYYTVPIVGSTVTVPSFVGNTCIVFLAPAAALATLNVKLPIATDGQEISICSSQLLTVFTLSATTGTVLGAITTLSASGFARYAWSQSGSRWFRSG